MQNKFISAALLGLVSASSHEGNWVNGSGTQYNYTTVEMGLMTLSDGA